MQLFFNGIRYTNLEACTLSMFLAQQNIYQQTQGIAIAVNETIVPREKWGTMQLKDLDRIEAVYAIQGG
jgi:sulfur carrier protein